MSGSFIKKEEYSPSSSLSLEEAHHHHHLTLPQHHHQQQQQHDDDDDDGDGDDQEVDMEDEEDKVTVSNEAAQASSSKISAASASADSTITKRNVVTSYAAAVSSSSQTQTLLPQSTLVTPAHQHQHQHQQHHQQQMQGAGPDNNSNNITTHSVAEAEAAAGGFFYNNHQHHGNSAPLDIQQQQQQQQESKDEEEKKDSKSIPPKSSSSSNIRTNDPMEVVQTTTENNNNNTTDPPTSSVAPTPTPSTKTTTTNNTTNTTTTTESTQSQSTTSSSSCTSSSRQSFLTTCACSNNKQQQQPCTSSIVSIHGKNTVLKRLSEALFRCTLTMINLSQRGLTANDAKLIKLAILHNPQLSKLKLGYNCLGDEGVQILASAIGPDTAATAAAATANHRDDHYTTQRRIQHHHHHIRARRHYHHHPSLSVLDLGFNGVGDAGCAALATHVVSNNYVLRTLYLSGNTVGERGCIALASAMQNGCGLTCLHLTANRVGPQGVKDLTLAILQNETKRLMLFHEQQQQQQQQQQQRHRGGNTDGAISLEGSSTVSTTSSSSTQGLDAPCSIVVDSGGADGTRDIPLKSIEELFLGGVAMGSSGCLSVSNMLLTNFSLRVLSLSDNGINDHDIALFSQSISRNKKVPLEVLQLSFNRLTCVGVESLMNAIWGSTTLREIRLDNNRIHDRGAQLAAVVLTSVKLEVLDLGFNRITTGGIKALMKSLAENDTLLSLTLSGNPLDTNASKAVSYALAYNKSLRALYVDNCSVGYEAQRHITAGVVSNSRLSLRVITGFRVGAIAKTLGLPAALENWTNEQLLKFIRLMWDRKRHEEENSKQNNDQKMNGDSLLSSAKNDAAAKNAGQPAGTAQKIEKQKVGPSDPATVVAAAKSAFATLGDAGGALLQTEPNQRELSDGSPIVPTNAIMLEKTLSGTVRVPKFENATNCSPNDDELKEEESLGLSLSHMSTGSLSVTNLRSSATLTENKKIMDPSIDPTRKKRNIEWLRQHFSSLQEVAQLPFNQADLLTLQQYFFSTVESSAVKNGENVEMSDAASSARLSEKEGSGAEPSKIPSSLSQQNARGFSSGFLLSGQNASTSQVQPPYPTKLLRKTSVPGLTRKTSYRYLNDALTSPPVSSNSNPSGLNSSGRRRAISVVVDNATVDPILQPASKRARNTKPRIAYYPRIREKLELLLTKNDKQQTLVLLRQLKFVEKVMFKGRDIYTEPRAGADDPNLATSTGTIDAEIILVDML